MYDLKFAFSDYGWSKKREALSAFINNISILDFGRKTAETAARIIDEAKRPREGIFSG